MKKLSLIISSQNNVVLSAKDQIHIKGGNSTEADIIIVDTDVE